MNNLALIGHLLGGALMLAIFVFLIVAVIILLRRTKARGRWQVGTALDFHAFVKESGSSKQLDSIKDPVICAPKSIPDNPAVSDTIATVDAQGSLAPANTMAQEEPYSGPVVPLRLACLDWPGEPGLEGHSDGDAVAHAICDALFAASGTGDMGTHFGTDRPQWANASGEAFLRQTCQIVKETGFEIGNVSVQVIANRPRLGKRREEAQRVLSEIIGAPVSVSATTSDGMGFTGRGEGMAVIASALVR